MNNKIYIIRWSEIDSSGETSEGITASAYRDINDAKKELATLKKYEIDDYINRLGYDEDYIKACTCEFMSDYGFTIKTNHEQTLYIIEEMEVK